MFKHLQNNRAMKISSAHQASSTNIFGVWSFADAPSASQLDHTHLLSHLQTLAEQSSYENFISLPGLLNQHFWRLRPANSTTHPLTSYDQSKTLLMHHWAISNTSHMKIIGIQIPKYGNPFQWSPWTWIRTLMGIQDPNDALLSVPWRESWIPKKRIRILWIGIRESWFQ